MTHTLTSVIDEKPGARAGAVISGNQPVSRPFVMAQKWPPPSLPSRLGLAGVKGDDAGRFQIAGLATGGYHLIALRSTDPAADEAAVERALLSAKKIEFGPSAIQNVALEVTDLR